MRIRHAAVAAAVFSLAVAHAARAELLIAIDKSTQTMTVAENGEALYTWPVSTGIARYDTPAGEFKPFRMERDHFSREWDDAPMPYSIFFTTKGHAIHGTYHKSLGQPASHGCVRLSVKHAAMLWALVRREKMANTRVVLTGDIPEGQPAVARQDNGEDVVATAPPRRRTARGWREYSDGPRYYYERERPYYPPPPRYRYRDDVLPFGLLFGR